jgi:hypothetical protein
VSVSLSGRTLGRVFLRYSDLENMTANGLINLVANTRFGVVPESHFKTVRRYSRTVNICMSLGNIMETLALFLLLLLLLLLLLQLLLLLLLLGLTQGKKVRCVSQSNRAKLLLVPMPGLSGRVSAGPCV